MKYAHGYQGKRECFIQILGHFHCPITRRSLGLLPSYYFLYQPRRLIQVILLHAKGILPLGIPRYTSANDGTWSSKPPTLESKASVASNLH